MLDKMKQMMEMKKQADVIKKQLDATEIEVNDSAGIKIVMTCSNNIRAIDIDESLLGAENKSKLESKLMQSLNAAVKKAQTAAAQKMASVMPGF